MVSMRWRTEGGPMPPNVVNTHGRKVRLREMEPAACLLIFSAQRLAMMARGSMAAAATYEGRRGQLTVKSMAIGDSRRASVSTKSTLVFEVREELRWAVVVASRLPSSERCLAAQQLYLVLVQ